MAEAGIRPGARGGDARSAPRAVEIVAGLIFALALALRLGGLGTEPFWFDEWLSAARVGLNFHDLVLEAGRSLHTPVYFLLLKGMAALGGLVAPGHGTDPWMLRLPSALAGSATAALAALLAGRLAAPGRGAALAAALAGLMVACAPFQLLYGQEARSYALVGLTALVALAASVELAEAGAAAGRGVWVAWVLGTGLALATLNDAVPLLVPALAALVVADRRSPPADRPLLRRRMAWAALGVLALWLPAAAMPAMEIGSKAAKEAGWIPPTSWAAIWQTTQIVYLFAVTGPVTFALDAVPPTLPVVVVVAAACWGSWWLARRRPAAFVPLVLGVVALPALLLAVSVFRPVFLPRYLFWSAPPFMVLAAIGLARLPVPQRLGRPGGRLVGAMAVALVVLLGLWSAATYQRTDKRARWDLAAAWVAANVQPGDRIYLVDWMGQYDLTQSFHQVAPGRPMPVMISRPADVAAALNAGQRVWLVWGQARYGQRERPADYLHRQEVAMGVRHGTIRHFGPLVLVAQLLPPRAPPPPVIPGRVAGDDAPPLPPGE